MNPRFPAFLASLVCLALAARAADSAPASPASATPAPPGPATASPAVATPAVAAPAPADKPPAPKRATVEEIRARLLEHLREKTEKAREPDLAKDATKTPSAKSAVSPAEPVHVLPKVEIKQMPITELDEKLAQQNRDIAREKQNTTPTPLDDTLNSKKVSKFFSIFGGQSSDQRATVASERVSMMEDEKDLIEAIAEAQTKEEKAELEKALADLRTNRRELEESLR